MARYLIVAHQTATSTTLEHRLEAIAQDDRDATFTLLVPATHPKHLLKTEREARFVWDDRAVHEVARQQADDARSSLERAGLRIERADIGDESPVLAIEDELRAHPGEYEAIVLSTLPPGRSRWLELDVHRPAERLGVPIIHVWEGQPEAETAGALRQAAVSGSNSRRAFGTRLSEAVERFEQRLPRRARGVLFPLAVLMFLYLLGSAVLAVTFDRGFFLNDAVALIVFAVVLATLIVSQRREARDDRKGYEDYEDYPGTAIRHSPQPPR